MAVILGNKYQSKNRDNFRKITGLSEANEKIKPENMPRIYGGIGEVYFNGQSAAGSSTGNGGGTTGTTDPNGGNDDPSGGSGGSGGSGNCACVSISETDGVVGIPCCVSGVDCEDGTPIGVQLKPSGEPIIPCETPKPPAKDDPNTIIIRWTKFNGFASPSTEEYELSTMDSGAGDANAAMQNSIASFRSNVSACGGMYNENCQITGTFSNNGKSFDYCQTMRFNTEKCGVFSSSIIIMIATNNDSYYNAGLENWNKKNKRKQYFVKDGKFYDACDPYGTPPSSEPITMCDENGDPYEVSPDGKITEL